MADPWRQHSDLDLLGLYSGVLTELRRRGVIRSSNNPVADYAEGLAAQAFGLELAPRSTTGYDGSDAAGRRYEVKSRRLTPQNQSRKVSFIRRLDEQHFDFLIGILFEEDFTVRRACLMPFAVVRDVATYREYVNGWDFHLRDDIWELEGVEDVTTRIRGASGQ